MAVPSINLSSSTKVKEPKKKSIHYNIMKADSKKAVKSRGLKMGSSGLKKTWKSLTMAQLGLFNSEFLPQIERNGMNGVVKLLKSGVLPEVEKILIGDMDVVWKERILTMGLPRKLLKPLLDKLEVVELLGENPDNGKYDFDITKDIIEYFIGQIKDGGENILAIFDPFSDYKTSLDGSLFSYHGKRLHLIRNYKAGKGEDSGLLRTHYAWRNMVWEQSMKAVRKSKAWVGMIFKLGEVPKEIIDDLKKKGKPVPEQYYIKWVKGSDYWIDVCWRHEEQRDILENVSKVMVEYEYGYVKPAQYRFELPFGRMAGLMYLEQIADSLLDDTEEDSLW